MITKIFITIFFTSLFFAACCTCGNVGNNGSDIPERLKNKADDFVISKTGKDFFDHHIETDYEKITKIKDGYLVVYNFSIGDMEGVEGEIRFSIDSLGNIQKDKEIAGIPDCSSGNENCGFSISKNEAENIAQRSGLEKGIKDWEIDFEWDAEYKKYVWQIRTTLSENKGTDFYRGSGKTMKIDTAAGKIIETKDWRVN